MIDKEKVLKFYEKYMLLIGIAGHFIFVLQAYKILSCGSASDVSLEGFIVAFLSLSSWLFYGYLKGDKILIIVNIFGVITSSICILSIILIRNGIL